MSEMRACLLISFTISITGITIIGEDNPALDASSAWAARLVAVEGVFRYDLSCPENKSTHAARERVKKKKSRKQFSATSTK
jgi:hypothetical protein